MSSGFQVRVRTEEDKKLLVFRISGTIDSPRLIDTWIETYTGMAKPWEYNRIFDYRRSDGIVEFTDLERFSAWWQVKTGGVDYASKVAVVVNNPLDEVRVHLVAKLFPNDERASFYTYDEALQWLEGKAMSESPRKAAS